MSSFVFPSTSHTRPVLPQNPIGVFDSGVGGLTVVAALRKILPCENVIYLGDTARVPYGGKSPSMITKYSEEISTTLLQAGAKMIVVACNTASALALPALKTHYTTLLQGVIEPGARAAIKATKNGLIGVIGTRATVTSNAYEQAIHALQGDLQVTSLACPLLVPLIEEGLFEDSVTDLVLERYLAPLLKAQIDTLVLGCTHYPLLKKRIASIVGPHITLVDSAENCAHAVKEVLRGQHLLSDKQAAGTLDILLTDTSEGFLHLAAKTLDLQIHSVTVSPL